MNTEEILLEIIDLSLAIKDNNLDKAIDKVNNINNNLYLTDITGEQLKDLLSLTNNYDSLNVNETFYYVLNNLIELKNSKEIITEIKVIELIKNYTDSRDPFEIRNYITENLNNAFSTFDYKVLIRLSNII